MKKKKEKCKCWNKRSTLDMEYGEFVAWSTRYVHSQLLQSGSKGMADALWLVIDQALRNNVFGKGE